MKTKSILLALFLAFTFLDINAQEETIIYQNYEPDSCHIFTGPWGSELFSFDIDGDGSHDLAFQSYEGDMYSTWLNAVVFADWQMTMEHPAFPYPDSVQLDTLQYWDGNFSTFIPIIHPGAPSYITKKICLRNKVGDDYYYAWIKTDGGWIDSQAYACVEEFAFSTIPNYPLKWGQKSLTGIAENDKTTSFASLYPNPTTGLITITGENLWQAEVFNVLGQRVVSVQGEGNELHIDLAALPAGIYFVNITDNKGRKYMRKVVKE